MANSVDPDQTAPIGAVCSGSSLFASILNLSVMLGNYLQQSTSADNIFFRCIFFLGALRIVLSTRIKYDFFTNAINIIFPDWLFHSFFADKSHKNIIGASKICYLTFI